MGKRPEIEDFRPEGILLSSIDNRLYSDADINAIIVACSTKLPEGKQKIKLPRWRSDQVAVTLTRREALATRLEIAAARYTRDVEWAKAPNPSQLKARFKKIQTAAAALLKTLGLGTRNRSNPDLIPHALLSRFRHHPMFLAGNGTDRVREIVSGVKMIYDWAERELWMAKTRPAAKLVNKGDKPFNDLLLRLGKIWSETFELKPRVSFIGGNSSNKGQPCGPFFAFVKASLGHLKLPSRLTAASSLGDRLDRLFGPKMKRRPKHVATPL